MQTHNYEGGTLKFVGGTTGRTVKAIASDGSVDRMGDIVVPSGVDFASFKRNPVILAGHDANAPIAKATSIACTGTRLEVEIEFPPQGASTRADETLALIRSGVLSALSIGFSVTAAEPIDKAKPYNGQRFTKTELLEISIVAIPANANALITQRRFDLDRATRIAEARALRDDLDRPARSTRQSAPAGPPVSELQAVAVYLRNANWSTGPLTDYQRNSLAAMRHKALQEIKLHGARCGPPALTGTSASRIVNAVWLKARHDAEMATRD